MGRINFMVEVPQQIIDEVITPKKASKKLTKFVNKLLESYYEDEYIRSYVDGDLRNEDTSVANELRDILDDISNTSREAAMGAEFAKAQAEATKSEFESGHVESSTEDGVASSAEFTALSDKVDRLASLIETLISSGVSAGVADPREAEGTVTDTPVSPKKVVKDVPILNEEPPNLADDLDNEEYLPSAETESSVDIFAMLTESTALGGL